MFKKNSPGCPCCESCEFFSDDFNRADDDDPGDYTEVSGDWDIVSSVLSTASSSGVLTGDTANPVADSNTKVSVTVNIATDGDIARIILAYLNSSNYWFAEVKAGTGAYLRIYQRSGGSNTQKATVSITRATGSFGFCASIENDNLLSTSIESASQQLSWADTFTDTGWGLGTGALTGTVTFDDLSVSTTGDGCPPCSFCSACTDNAFPAQVKAVISGVADSTCTFCAANYNGTFYLSLRDVGGGNCAVYEYPFGSPPCSFVGRPLDAIEFVIDPSPAGLFKKFTLAIESKFGTALSAVGPFYGTDTAQACLTMTNISLPYISDGASPTCDGSGATVLVSAV